MISVAEDCEYAILFADLIETLSRLDKFVLKIWVNGSELPFEFYSSFDFHFVQEGIRISDGNDVMYVFYDTITYVRVLNES